MKVNRIYGWEPLPYESTTEKERLPEEVPEAIKNKIIDYAGKEETKALVSIYIRAFFCQLFLQFYFAHTYTLPMEKTGVVALSGANHAHYNTRVLGFIEVIMALPW